MLPTSLVCTNPAVRNALSRFSVMLDGKGEKGHKSALQTEAGRRFLFSLSSPFLSDYLTGENEQLRVGLSAAAACLSRVCVRAGLPR